VPTVAVSVSVSVSVSANTNAWLLRCHADCYTAISRIDILPVN
jgi:hypothetical protein